MKEDEKLLNWLERNGFVIAVRSQDDGGMLRPADRMLGWTKEKLLESFRKNENLNGHEEDTDGQ